MFYVCLSLQIAMSCMDNSLLKYSAKDHFFRAAVCHLCVDTLNAQQALTRYEELFPQFADSRECKLLKVVWIVYLLLLVHSQGRVWYLYPPSQTRGGGLYRYLHISCKHNSFTMDEPILIKLNTVIVHNLRMCIK